MAQAALGTMAGGTMAGGTMAGGTMAGGIDDAGAPTRYVFDEGHHLLDAADAAFSVRLSK